MSAQSYSAWFGLFLVLIGASACTPPNKSSRVSTQELILNAVVIRHDDQLLVQATLNPKHQPDYNLKLQEQERIEVQLGEHRVVLEPQWNDVYSIELPFQEAPMRMTLYRQEGRNDIQPMTSTLYLDSPRFISPEPRELFHTQTHSVIPLEWLGQPEDRGEYQLFCTDRTQGMTQVSGSFVTSNRQQVNLSLETLLGQHEALDRRALCEGIFTLRGISTRADFATALGGGRFLFESNVSRPVLIRHNRSITTSGLTPH